MNSDLVLDGPDYNNPENNIQPFFVLHRGCSSSSSSLSRPKSKRKLNEESVHEFDDRYLYNLRISAFHYVWSNIDTTIKGVLKEINLSIFNEVSSWVHQSFKAVRSCGEPGYAETTHPYPIALDALSKQIYTGLVYTKNMEFVDNQLTFEELGNHLKSGGCHVANMSSLDFSAKNGIGGCLTRLLRMFMKVTLDDADMSILASWYFGQRESTPVVIIIEDMERCCASVLSNFILMLSKWVVKIPVILVMGVATTLYSPENLLSSNALLCLRTCKFVLGSPAQRMDAIAEAVLLRPCSRFNVGHKVAVFMKDYFLKHDGTLTSFIRSLKISCMLLFSSEPLSFLLKDLDAEDDFQEIWKEKHAFIQDIMLKHSSQLSCRGDDVGELTSENLIHAIGELKRLHQRWITVVKCLHEAGKHQNLQLLDLYCDALDPDVHKSGTSYKQGRSLRNGCLSSQYGGSPKRPYIYKAVNKVRDLSPAALSELLNNWERHADGVCEIGDKVKELQVMMNSVDSKSSGSDLMYDSSWPFASNHFHIKILEALGTTILKSQKSDAPKDPKLWNSKAVALIEWMLRDQMKPIESFPFHVILCFKIVDKLQTALLGDPRRRIQADLLEFHEYLHSTCCSTRGSRLLPSLHDTSILYVLAQEHGDIINVHDWFQSFKAILVTPPTKARNKSKHSSTPKKKKDINNLSEAAIQARFCKAVSELQVTGLLRMPTKRRPDFVQRVAFGL